MGTMRERSPGSWELTVSAGVDPSTGRCARVIQTIRAATKREAKAALRELDRSGGGLGWCKTAVTDRDRPMWPIRREHAPTPSPAAQGGWRSTTRAPVGRSGRCPSSGRNPHPRSAHLRCCARQQSSRRRPRRQHAARTPGEQAERQDPSDWRSRSISSTAACCSACCWAISSLSWLTLNRTSTSPDGGCVAVGLLRRGEEQVRQVAGEGAEDADPDDDDERADESSPVRHRILVAVADGRDGDDDVPDRIGAVVMFAPGAYCSMLRISRLPNSSTRMPISNSVSERAARSVLDQAAGDVLDAVVAEESEDAHEAEDPQDLQLLERQAGEQVGPAELAEEVAGLRLGGEQAVGEVGRGR